MKLFRKRPPRRLSVPGTSNDADAMENPFVGLVGEQLSSVTFVADYVQFDFNGPRLTALTDPIVRQTRFELEKQFPEPSSRDALCSLLGQEVASANFREGHRLEVAFASGDALVLPLDEDSYHGPEGLEWFPDGNVINIHMVSDGLTRGCNRPRRHCVPIAADEPQGR